MEPNIDEGLEKMVRRVATHYYGLYCTGIAPGEQYEKTDRMDVLVEKVVDLVKMVARLDALSCGIARWGLRSARYKLVVLINNDEPVKYSILWKKQSKTAP